jgi:hypothetical protein
MNQLPLLPIQLVDEQPADRTVSKDLLFIGFDEQDRRYALKTVEPNAPLLPLTEWLCYHLCRLAGIITPEFSVVLRLDGSPAFGSRWEENAREFSPAKVSEADLLGWLQKTRADTSGMFVMDGFMPNPDRHLGNILFVQTGARLRALAFDWSRTAIFEPWPWTNDCNSAQNWRWFKAIGNTDAAAFHARLQRLQAVTDQQVLEILQAAPELWRNNVNIEFAAQWWQANRDNRAKAVSDLLKP